MPIGVPITKVVNITIPVVRITRLLTILANLFLLAFLSLLICNVLCDVGIIDFSKFHPGHPYQEQDYLASSHDHDHPGDHFHSGPDHDQAPHHDHDTPAEDDFCCEDYSNRVFSGLIEPVAQGFGVKIESQVIFTITLSSYILFPYWHLHQRLIAYRLGLPPPITYDLRVIIQSFLF